MSAWPRLPLGEIFEIARGGSPRPIDDYITDADDGVNWISIADASDSAKYIERTKRRIRPEGVARSRLVAPGDFLLTNSMSFGRNRPANSPWRDEGQRSLRIAMLAVLMLKAVASKGPPHQCQ
jgi:hypothetical protein